MKLWIIGLLALASTGIWSIVVSPSNTLADEVRGFHSWTKVNAKPMKLSYRVNTLCRPATPVESARAQSDPHKERFVTVWVNPIGKNAMLSGKSFPVGSAIVKEKFAGEFGPAELSTVMIKREKGFNPKCGDWEFGTLNDDGSVVTSQGKLKLCVSCHVEQSALDFTYRTYVPTRKNR